MTRAGTINTTENLRNELEPERTTAKNTPAVPDVPEDTQDTKNDAENDDADAEFVIDGKSKYTVNV